MMKGRMLQKVWGLLLTLVAISLAVDAKDFRVAVFWNDATGIVPYETPVGYNVGSGTDGTEAPEIGKSGLKLFLASMDDRVGYDGTTTLDTTDVKESVTDNSGVLNSTPGVLPNVRIYSSSDESVTLQTLKEDFGAYGDSLPEVIAVINGGGQVNNPVLKQLLYDASKAEVGILLVGSASTAFAVGIDELAAADGNKYFAVKGIQEAFNVEGYAGSLIFDFDLVNGSSIKQDSVILLYDYDGVGVHSIRQVSNVDYDEASDSYTCDTGAVVYSSAGTNNLKSGITVEHYYGQFSISGALAQSVIEYDSYDPAMNSGIFYDEAVLAMNGALELITTEDIVANNINNYSGNTIPAGSKINEAGTAAPFGSIVTKAFIKVEDNGSYGNVLSYKTGDELVIPGLEAYGNAYIHEVSGSELKIFTPSKGDGSVAVEGTKFTNPRKQEYPEDGTDYFITLKAGDTVFVYNQTSTWGVGTTLLGKFIVTEIKDAPEGYRFTFTDTLKINNSVIWAKGETFDFSTGYELRYPARGYDTLALEIKDLATSGNSEIFTKIFTNGKTAIPAADAQIPFKKWEANGRIQSAAEIWAVDYSVPVAEFSDWYGTSGAFDTSKYYFARFGQQVARGDDQFYYLSNNGSSFDKVRFDALPDASNDRFKKKEYYALSVVQHSHQRVAIVGYEPQYLENSAQSKNIIHDLILWSAVDDSRMPEGKLIIGDSVVTNGDVISTKLDTIKIVLDFSKKDKDVYDQKVTVTGTIAQGDDTLTVNWDDYDIIKDPASQIDTLIFIVSDQIDPSGLDTLSITDITITGGAPTESTIDDKDLPLQKLVITADFDGKTVTTDSTLMYTGIKDLTVTTAQDNQGKDVSGVNITAGSLTGTDSLKTQIKSDETLTISATKDGYMNADQITLTFDKTNTTVPTPILSVDTSSNDYLFGTTTTFQLYLDPADENSALIKDGEYSFEMTYAGIDSSIGSLGTQADPTKFIVSPADVDAIIKDALENSQSLANGMVITGTNVSKNTDLWTNNSSLAEWKYNYRTLNGSVTIPKTTAATVDVTFGDITDAVTGAVLSDAVYYYQTGTAFGMFDTAGVKTAKAGDVVTLSNDVNLYYTMYRTGYIPNEEATMVTAETFVVADSGIFWGETYDITVNSNRYPVSWSSTNNEGKTQTGSIAESGSKVIALGDAFAKRDNDTVVITYTTSDNKEFVYNYYRRKLSAPTYSPTSGTFTGDVNVTISNSNGSVGTIWSNVDTSGVPTSYAKTVAYTVDGSFAIFSAYVEALDWLSSDTASMTYTRKVDLSGGAAFFDSNADGFIDSAVINIDFDASPDSITVYSPWDNSVLAVLASGYQVNSSVITIAFGDDLFPYGTGFDPGEYLYLAGNNYDDYANVVDSAAPVITSAKVVSSKDNGSAYDYLYVKFSENMTQSSVMVSNPVKLYTSQNAAGVIPTVTESAIEYITSGTYEDMYKLTIAPGDWGNNVTYPVNGIDSININVDASVEDLNGNVQDDPANRKVALEVVPKPIEVEMTWFWKDSALVDFWGDGNAVKASLQAGGNPALESEEAGVVILLDPKSELSFPDFPFLSIELTVLDQLGHLVVSGSSGPGAVISTDQIQSSPAYFKVSDGITDAEYASGIALFWNARNSVGRAVGPQAYKIVVTTTWPGGKSDEQVGIVKVFDGPITKATK